MESGTEGEEVSNGDEDSRKEQSTKESDKDAL